jgi:SpoU rRNA methylase family enzyme
MDLVNSIVSMDQANNMAKVQYAVAAKIMQADRNEGNAAMQLVTAATSNFNQAGDAVVAAATGLGGNVDTYA